MAGDRIISEEILDNRLNLQKSVLEGKRVDLYTNFHTGGDFALRVSGEKATVYIDGEEECIWKIGDRSCGAYWHRSSDSKRAKGVKGIINRCQKEGFF